MKEQLSEDRLVFNNLELSKVIPEHVQRHRFKWLKRSFWKYTADWRRIRGKDPIDSCRWCGRQFEEGESMSLAGPEKGANWIVCEPCADQMEGNPCP